MPRALVLVALFLAALCPSAAQAERKVALVVGNGAYTHVPKLPNPTNDSAAMADLLRRAGFEVVEAKNDLGSLDFKRVVRDFSQQVRDADIAVMYFAGHGLEIGGINYLIPTDARLASDLDAEDEALSVDRVVRILEPARRLRLVILDACRDNPFVKGMRRSIATRAVSRGLQGELKRVGCDPGSVNGDWGPKSRQALTLFNKHAGTRLDAKVASLEAIEAVRGKHERVCPLTCGRGTRAEGDTCVAIREPAAEPKPRERKVHEPVSRREPPKREERRATPARQSPRESRSGGGGGPISPLCQSFFSQGGRKCCSYDPPSGAPRVICQ